MTKSTTLSLTLSVKSTLTASILLIASLCNMLNSQEISLSLTNGETQSLECSGVNGISVLGEGTVNLYSSEGPITISGNAVFGENVTVTSSQQIFFSDHGSLSANQIDADIAFLGSWEIEKHVQVIRGKEALFHNAQISLGNNSFYSEKVVLTGSNTINGQESKFIGNNEFLIVGEVDFNSNIDFRTRSSESTIEGPSELPIQFVSSVLSTCGTGPGETPFTIDAFVNTSYNGEDISCNGADDAEVCVNVTGGSGDFSFQWFGDGPAANTGMCYTGLGAGTYTVLVTDITQGITCVENVQVTEPAPLAIFSLNLSLPSCADNCDGTSFPIVLGGISNSPYSYLYSNSNTNQVATDLCSGSNTLTISDINGCSIDTTFLLDVEEILAGLTFTDTLCFGDNTGIATSNPTGGSGAPYTWDWSTGGSTNEITGLTAGSYDLTVFDSTGCDKDTTFVIEEYSEIIITLDELVNPVCSNDAEGILSITPAGGTPDYTYEWTFEGAFYSSDQNLTDLLEGDYTVTVTDFNGCFASQTYSLNAAQSVEITSIATNPLCSGSCDGSIEITITAGLAPFNIEWSDVNGIFSDQLLIDDLCAGTYSLFIRDANNCEYTEDFTLDEGAEVTLTEVVTDISCNGLTDGMVELTITDGTAPFTANLPFTTIAPNVLLFENLGSGTVNIVVTDANGCQGQGNYDIQEPEAIVIDVDDIQALQCFGDADASIEISITGGTEPYGIVWVELAIFDQTTVSDLPAGTYTVEVTDANLCFQSTSIDIDAPEEITVTSEITNVNCNGELTGAIDLTVTGAVDPLTVVWAGGVPNPNDLDQTGLGAGTYSVTITDANNCQFTSDYDVTEEPSIEITETISQPLCFGDLGEITISIEGGVGPYSINWVELLLTDVTNVSDLGPGNYTVIVTDANGCEETEVYEILTIEELTITPDITQPGCLETTGSIEILVEGGTEPYTIIWNGLNEDGETLVEDLLPGDYTVNVTDVNDCTAEGTYTVLEPEDLDVTSAVTDVFCFGEATGEIDLTVTNGVNPLTVVWTGGVANPNDLDQTGLTAGTYNVNITDADGCSFQDTFDIVESEEIIITETIVQPGCLGTTGSIEIAITGGAGPYTIIWTGLNEDGETLVEDLNPGDYTVTVTDANNCSVQGTYTITDPGVLDVSADITQVLCHGDATGEIDLTVTGAVDPLNVVWTGAVADANALDQIDLVAGLYSVNITDADGCNFTEDYEITEEEEIIISETIVQPGCGGTTGSIEITIQGGVNPLTIIWNGLNEDGETLVEDLNPGDYTVTVTDANNCTADGTYTITEPGVLDVSADITHVICNGELTGEIDLTVTDGADPLTIIWSGGVPSPNDLDQTGLAAGTYTVDITDADGCSFQGSYEVLEETAIDITENITQPGCAGGLGEIQIAIAGGVPNYSINWIDLGIVDETLVQGLLAGDYCVQITDANGCFIEECYTITDPGVLDVSADITHVLCNGDATGAIDLTATGAVEPIAAVWTGNTPNPNDVDQTGLPAGLYSVSITDANGCQFNSDYEITESEEIVITPDIIQPGCTGTTGSIEITIQGGVNPMSIVWAGLNQNDQTLVQNLNPGNYMVTVTDANNCTAEGNYTITEPGVLDVSADITHVLCNGDLTGEIDLTVTDGVDPIAVVWTGAVPNPNDLDQTGLAPGIYAVDVTDADGCSFQGTYEVLEETAIDISENITQPGCAGDVGEIQISIVGGAPNYTINWIDLGVMNQTLVQDLAPGEYCVQVTDANGCFLEECYTISAPGILDVSADITHVLCNGEVTGAIDLTVTGATNPLTVLWTGGVPAPNSLDQTDLAAGSYSVSITDANGCDFTADYEVLEEQIIDISETVTQPSCFGDLGEITIAIQGGVGPYTLEWVELAITDQTTVTDLPTGTYTVSVTDANDCEVTEAYEILVPEELILTEDIIQPGCTGTEGSIEITITGGTAPYTIIWAGLNEDGETSIENLLPGDYSVTVTDFNNCAAQADYTITAPGVLDVSADITHVLCNGEATGAIDLTVTGGLDPLTVVWTGGVPNPNDLDQTGLSAGIYSVDITDADGCSFQGDFEVLEETAIEITEDIDQPACPGEFGEIEITITGGSEPYTIEWVELAIFDETTVTDLPAGSYTVNVTDANNCTITEVLDVVVINELTIDEVITQPGCSGATTGTIEITVSGGTQPYDIVWDGLDEDGETLIEDLVPGDYCVEVLDDNDCFVEECYTITAPGVLDVSSDVTDVLCFGESTGSITLTVTGQVDPLNVVWDGPIVLDDQLVQTDLPAGSYTVTIIDAVDCSFIRTYDILEETEIVIDETVVQPLCFGDLGQIDVSITGGVEPYDITWNQVGSQNQTSLTDLADGDYIITVTDANLCQVIETYTIAAPEELNIDETITQPLCFGELGEITITITGGTEDYAIEWPELGIFDQTTVSDLPSGNYSVTITDANGCQISESYAIQQFEELTIESTVVQPECFFEFGSISCTISGGVEPYTIDWTGITAPGETNLLDLVPGDYTINILDANGCTTEETFTIEEPYALEVAPTIAQPNCFGENTGAIAIDVTNQTGDLNISWTNTDLGYNSPSEDIDNLFAGVYTLQMSDELGCVFTGDFEVEETSLLDIQLESITHETCLEDLGGAIDISTTGGTGTIAFSWSGNGINEDTEDISGLSAGDYQLEVIDENGCSASESFTVESGAEIDLETTTVDTTCGNAEGSAQVIITADNDIDTIVWTDGVNTISSTENAENLAAGTYDVTVTDDQGCLATATVTISDTDGPVIDAQSTDVLCFGDDNGSITVAATEGLEPYVFTWTDGPMVIAVDETNPTGLLSGDYTLNVTDANGCEANAVITVETPEELLIFATLNDVTCNNTDNGSIEIAIEGGTPEFDIQWSPNNETTELIENLAPGDYNVIVTDANDCLAEGFYSLIEESPITITADFDDILCFGQSGTDILIDVDGGQPGYSFQWSGDISSQNEDLSNVPAGNYTLTVTDALGCTESIDVVISQNAELTLEITEVEPSCLLNDGMLTAAASGGTGTGYSYFWYDLDNGSTLISTEALATDLAPGNFFVEVFDSAGCIGDLEVALSNDTGEVTADVSHVLCNGEPTGAIDIEITGLTDPLTVSWTGPNDFTSDAQDIQDLEAGTYGLEVTDANGCMQIENYEVESTDELLVGVAIINNCFGVSGTGAIELNISGGTEPYTVTWTGTGFNSTDEDISDLDSGCYQYTVVDANGCETSSEVCIVDLDELILDAVVTDNFCFNDENGTIELTVAGGDPEYSIEWVNESNEVISNDLIVENLPIGDFTVTVIDESLCEATSTETIFSNPEIIAETESSLITCEGDDNGGLSITYSGGVGQLNLEWTGPDFTSTEDVISDLAPGDYCYTITDEVGCVLEECISIADPEPLVISETLTQVSCHDAADGNISVDISGGYPDYEIIWTSNLIEISQELEISDLEPGDYQAEVTDSEGCSTAVEFEITQPEEIEFTIDNIMSATCETSSDGAFEITATGGSGTYAYSWLLDGEEVSAEEDPEGLGVGDYELIITDDTGCELNIGSIVLQSLGDVEVSAPDDINWCFDGVGMVLTAEGDESIMYWQNEDGDIISNNLELEVNEEPGVYEYYFFGEDAECVISDTVVVTIFDLPTADAGEDQEAFLDNEVVLGGDPTTDGESVQWSSGSLLSDSTAFNPIYNVTLDIQEFVVTATSSDGCTTQDTVVITLAPELDVHSGFTPNDDGTNDTWIIGNVQNYPNTEVFVYNRWGDELFYSLGYGTPWDGKFNGELLPIGTYYYVIIVDEPDLQLQLDGPVTIIR